MGSYTEFKCSFKLRKDTPAQITTLRDRIINDFDSLWEELSGKQVPVFSSVSDRPDLPIDHEFGKCTRWPAFFNSTNWGSIPGSTSFCKESLLLNIHSEFKNYDGEIDLFIDWLSPYILGRKKKQYLGYSHHESCKRRDNIYIHR